MRNPLDCSTLDLLHFELPIRSQSKPALTPRIVRPDDIEWQSEGVIDALCPEPVEKSSLRVQLH
jgi:hypothetical protein